MPDSPAIYLKNCIGQEKVVQKITSRKDAKNAKKGIKKLALRLGGLA
jgi:hypothetical protein